MNLKKKKVVFVYNVLIYKNHSQFSNSYYGFGDIQLMRIIDKLAIFFSEEDNHLTLNRKGHEVLLMHLNFASELNDKMIFGNVTRLNFQFNKQENKLIKTILHVN